MLENGYVSPSMRREWIEIPSSSESISIIPSPSMRREWIEMMPTVTAKKNAVSPSMRREWIEIEIGENDDK